MEAYRARPPYQQNDDIGWSVLAKGEETRQKRLLRVLEELRAGDRSSRSRARRSGPNVGITKSAHMTTQSYCPHHIYRCS